MNKKILFGAAIVGLLGFGSCVDNTESASVTAVRQAKAEQMKALGEAAKVEAQAKELQAQAEKELKDAQAAYERAQAAYQEAQTAKEKELAAIQIQEAQEALNNTIKQNELNLEKLKAQVEQEQAAAKKQILENATDNQTLLNTLYNNYVTKTGTLLTDQQNLANTQATLAKLEANIINAKEASQAEIALKNKEIINYQNQIANAEEQIATYEEYSNATLPELEEQLADANDRLDAVNATLDQVKAAEAEAQANYNLAQARIDNSIYVQQLGEELIDGYYPNTFSQSPEEDAGIVFFPNPLITPPSPFDQYLDPESYPKAPYGWGAVPGIMKNGIQQVPNDSWLLYTGTKGKDGKYSFTFTLLVTGEDTETLSLDKPVDDEGQIPAQTAQYTIKVGYQVQAAGVEALDKVLDNLLKKNYTTPYEAAEKTYNDCVAAQKEAQTEVEKKTADKKDADDAVTAANKVVEDAGDKATEEQTKALADAKDKQTEAATKLAKAQGILQTKEKATDAALTAKNIAAQNLEEGKGHLDEVKAHFAKALAELPNYNKYVEAYNEASKAERQAEIDVIAPTQEKAEIQGEIQSLETLIAEGGGDAAAIASIIDNLDTQIITFKGEIVKLQQAIASLENPEETIEMDYKQYTVEMLNNEITRLQNKIAIDEEMVAAAKADLEAAIKAGSEE